MLKRLGGAALLVLLPVFSLLADEPDAAPIVGSDWLLATLKDAFATRDGDVLVLNHPHGDVRIEAGDTDRVQITALAQYHADDPRKPAIRIAANDAAPPTRHALTVDFAHLEIAENDDWRRRRIDIGLLVPKGLTLEIETADGVIEAKSVTARARLISNRGAITYKGTGSLDARSERGDVRAILLHTGADHRVTLGSLTSAVWCTFLEGANAKVAVETRGPITTDFSINIERAPGAALKTGTVQMGTGGSTVDITSNRGAVRLHGIIAPEDQGQ